MAYLSTYFKWGHKDKAGIDAIDTAQLTTGDNVYNTDINKEELWNGSVWVNDDCIVLINNEGSTMSVGQLVGVDNVSSTTDHCMLVDNTESDLFLGVVYRGATNGNDVVIATKGFYKVKFDSGVTAVDRQDIVILSATAGFADTSGAITGSTGSFGVIAESFAVMPADDLVNCWIQGSEKF